MAGFILNNIYQGLNNMKVLLFLILSGAVVLLVIGNATLVKIFVYISVAMFAVSGISNMHKDVISKWDRYELTLPIRRKDIVKSKFLSYLIWVFCGVVISFFFASLALLLHGNLFYNQVNNVASIFSLAIGLSVLTGAFFYPLAFIIGIDKSEVLMTISLLISMAFAMFLIRFINTLDLSSTVGLCIFNLTYITIYLCSYWISTKLYKKAA